MTEVFAELKAQLALSDGMIARLQSISGYDAHGFSRESLIQYLSTSEIVERWAACAHTELPGRTREEAVGAISAIFEHAALSDNVHIHPPEGTHELLGYLKSRNYHLGIATADTYASAVSSLRKAGLLGYFSFIGADGMNFKAKPDPEMASKFCEGAGILPDELLIVGDTMSDWYFAQNTRAKFVGIQTDYNDLGQLKDYDVPIVQTLLSIPDTMHL